MYLGALATTADGPLSSKFGFFGVLPDWQDVDGTCAEIDFLFAEQKLCTGVGAYTTYGDKLPGHESFRLIWEKLQGYGALVFLHPTSLDLRPRYISGFLPQPIVDYPLATTRAAVDLVFTGTMRSCPGVDVILSHAGGTLPFIGARAITALTIPPIAAQAQVTEKDAIADFARFYYDTALSTSTSQLGGLLDFISSVGGDMSHILFGSDFPYAPSQSIKAVLRSYHEFLVSGRPKAEVLRPEKLRANGIVLLEKHPLGSRNRHESL